MVDIGTLKKPLREWEKEEVVAFLKGLITNEERERFIHNNLTGSRLRDFCCMDFLTHVLRLTETSAAKVMSVLRPYLNEMEEDPRNIRTEYRYAPRNMTINSKKDTRMTKNKAPKAESRESVEVKGNRVGKDENTRKNRNDYERNDGHLKMDNPPPLLKHDANEMLEHCRSSQTDSHSVNNSI